MLEDDEATEAEEAEAAAAAAAAVFLLDFVDIVVAENTRLACTRILALAVSYEALYVVLD